MYVRILEGFVNWFSILGAGKQVLLRPKKRSGISIAFIGDMKSYDL